MSSQLAEDLSKQTRDLIERFDERARSFSSRNDLARLTVHVDAADAVKMAREYLGEGEHLATGIDGSMDFDERLQMMLFYSNATAYNCPFRVGERVEFDLAGAFRDSKLCASAAVPLWAEDVASVFSNEPEIDIELEHSMERIPNSFMTLGELYLAARATERSRLIFLDRPLSGTFSTLSRDARNLLKRGRSGLVDWGNRKASLLDIYLAINLGGPSMEVPARGGYSRLALVRRLMDGPMSRSELTSGLGLSDEAGDRAVKSLLELDKRHRNQLLEDSGERFALRTGVEGYWDRASGLALAYSDAVFGGRSHPLSLGGDDYLTILDVNALALFLLDLLCERAKERGALVIGIAKDTTATDISRAVLPFAVQAGLLRLSAPAPKLKSDKAFLAILSAENPSIATPWRTVSYDSAFSTVVNADGKFIAARKVVARERLFARSFFQLRSLRSDPGIRSQVFLMDRVYDSGRDGASLRRLRAKERSGYAELDAYFEGGEGSRLSNLMLHLLSLSDNPEVFEAFGHNQLLYLADKAVKAEVRMLRSSLRGVADLRVGGAVSRRKIFGVATTYREQRAQAEHARMRSSRR
jgi:hypothetical protein